MVNLAVDLREPRFGGDALATALRAIEEAGFSVECVHPGDDAFLAWLDLEFGGSWSSEAFAGSSVVAKRDGAFAGFATYGARGMRYSWLRGLGAQPGVGIFGPFGVAGAFRGSSIGPHLLTAALALLAQDGYAQALIPAVGHEKLIAYYERHGGAHVAERFDRARWSDRRFRTVVLASGNGSNFQSVMDRCAAGKLPLEIVMLVSNRASAFALERARNASVHAVAFPWDRNVQTREAYDAGLLELVRREEPDLLLLLGWMHVLGTPFVQAFANSINIHPAFLPLNQRSDTVGFPDGSTSPAFRGARAVADALAWGTAWVGASSHLVSADADRGPVLARKPLELKPAQTHDEVMKRLHPLEHGVLAGGIMRWVFEQ